MNGLIHHNEIPQEAIFQKCYNGNMSHGFGWIRINAENEITCPGRVTALSRSRRFNSGRSCRSGRDRGTVVNVPDPIEEQDWTCSPVKMIPFGRKGNDWGLSI